MIPLDQLFDRHCGRMRGLNSRFALLCLYLFKVHQPIANAIRLPWHAVVLSRVASSMLDC